MEIVLGASKEEQSDLSPPGSFSYSPNETISMQEFDLTQISRIN